MNLPLITIIIPTYNRAALIGDCLQSVLNQSYKNREIIVVDDGSTDNTQEVVASFGQDVLYVKKENSGPSATRNLGIKKAKGEYIAFLDSDDLWDEKKLEKQMAVFNQNPTVSLVASNFRYVDQNKVVIKDPGSQVGYSTKGHNVVEDLLKIQFPFATITFVLKKVILNDIGLFKEELRTAEDLDLLVRIALKYEVSYIDEVLASVRLHHNHLMRETPRYQVWLDSVHVLESHEKEIRRQIPEVNKYFANFYSIAANSALLSGERRKAFEIYQQTVRLQPFKLKGYKDCLRCLLPMSYLKAKNERSLKGSIPKGLENYK